MERCEEAKKLFTATCSERRSADSQHDPQTELHSCRKLVSQIEFNVRNHNWDPLTGLLVMKDLVQETSRMTDGEKVNNYADAALAKSSRFSNKSDTWRSQLTRDSPVITKFLQSYLDNKPEQNDSQLFLIKHKLRRELGPVPDYQGTTLAEKHSENKQDKNNGGLRSSFSRPGHSGPSPGISFGSIAKRVSPPSAAPVLSPADSNATVFPPVPQSSSVFVPSRASRAPSSAFAPSKASSAGVVSHQFSSFPPAQNKPGTGGYNRMQTPVYPVSNKQSRETATSAFRTAHEQLVIDQKQQGGRNSSRGTATGRGEITQASYGGARKCLGTRPGPAGGFKPPVRQVDDEAPFGGGRAGGGGGGRAGGVAAAASDASEELVDERYKNIDAKMVELIKNEIMDQGSPIAWEDIAGLEFAKDTVKEIVVWPMLRPDIFTGLRGPPKGLLLFGPPGTGKTLIGKCIACQSNSTFFAISASSLTSKWVGEGEKMVRALFAVAKVHQPSVVFIDEIDSLLSSRSDSEHEASRRIKTEFLVQLDGASTVGDERVLVVGATNRPQELDEAARRRLVKRLYIPLPESEARKQIIYNLLMKENHELTDQNIQDICEQTDGYSGADMANLCKEAAMGPIRSLDFSQIAHVRPDQVRPIRVEDLQAALRQVKASVSSQDLELYLDWNNKFGAGK